MKRKLIAILAAVTLLCSVFVGMARFRPLRRVNAVSA